MQDDILNVWRDVERYKQSQDVNWENNAKAHTKLLNRVEEVENQLRSLLESIRFVETS